MSGRYVLQSITEEAYAEFLEAMGSSAGDFHLTISSGGGDTDVMWAFHDVIRCTNRKIIGTAIGYCHSAAPLILASCSIRRCTPSTQFMVHEDICKVKGKPNQAMIEAERAQYNERRWYKAMQQVSSITIEDWRDLSEAESYFTAEEAANFGIVDTIIGFKR